jgi:N6-adenosine-specific RNA methylase IME4
MIHELTKLSEATTMLAEARTLEDIKAIRNLAEMAAAYAKAEGLGKEAQDYAAEIRLRAGRRAGEVLIAADEANELHKGGRPAKITGSTLEPVKITLSDLGIDKKQSSAWQTMAGEDVTDEIFEEVLAYAKEKGVTSDRAVADMIRKPAKRKERIERVIEAVTLDPPPLEELSQRYPVIYADPPWRYEHSETESRKIESHYPSMALDEICDLPVSEIATPDAVLFLWATSPKLVEAMLVIEDWGFTYRTCLVWDKERVGMGYYARQQHELLLVATRGSLPVPEPSNRPPSVIRRRRDDKHSQKPTEFYEVIEKMYPEYDKLELFARESREGWDAWGNEETK